MPNDEKTPALVAERVLVPVANPATAEGLLRLALSIVGEDGHVIAAFVMMSGAEARPNTLEKLEAIIAALREDDHDITLVTDIAPSIARGILDIAAEQRADLIVLGIRGRQRDKIVLGPVVDDVARTAPCNVLVYRGMQSLYSGEGYNEVIVPVDGSENSRLAVRLGLRFAEHTEAPLTAIYVQTQPGMKRYQALGRIEASLEGIPGTADARKLVVPAADVVSGILSRCDDDHLVVLGFSEQSSLDRWLFGAIPQRMLADAPGPLLLVKQMVGETVSSKLERQLANMLPTLTPAEEAEVTHLADEMSKPSTNYLVLVVLSSLIASFGLLQNSAAVIIGAMLIAPLMSPLMGFAVGLTQGNWRLMRISVLTTLRGVLLSLLPALVIGLLSPSDSPTVEMATRGQPSLPDMGVALFSGMAGAYAMARKDIPSALAGVAIAAALMPPLCTVGIALAFGLTGLASGAFLLFLTNIVSISLAGGAVFLWLGVRLREDADAPGQYRGRLLVSLAVLVMLAVPLTISLQNTLLAASELDAVWDVLEEELPGTVIDVQWEEGQFSGIVATVRMADPPTPEQVGAIEAEVEARVGQPVPLEVVVWQSVQAP